LLFFVFAKPLTIISPVRMAAALFSRSPFHMNIQCPICRSHQVVSLDRGKKIGGVIGVVGGAASGVAGAMTGAATGAEVGLTVGLVAGPVGSTLGSVAGAIFGALIGAATGGVTGAKLGEVIDQRVLDNYVCQDCGLSFSHYANRDQAI
jgi:hypothetical protein